MLKQCRNKFGTGLKHNRETDISAHYLLSYFYLNLIKFRTVPRVSEKNARQTASKIFKKQAK